MLSLTKREFELLRLLGEGHSQESAAAVMEVGYQSIKNCLRFARNKNKTNNYELIAKVAVLVSKQAIVLLDKEVKSAQLVSPLDSKPYLEPVHTLKHDSGLRGN